MKTSSAKQNLRSDDPVWVLLAELSLGDFSSDQDRKEGPAPGYLFQTIRELGVSPECIENIARTLADFTEETLARTRQGILEFSGRIRIFCQKKLIDDANSARLYHTKQSEEQKQVFPYSRTKPIGGWGYFMIERGDDLPPDSSAVPHNDMNLYLYKEGDVSLRTEC